MYSHLSLPPSLFPPFSLLPSFLPPPSFLTPSLLRRHQVEVDELTSRVRTLEQELASANELLAAANKRQSLSREELLSLSPQAARAGELLKSGLSLTQIYARYVEVDEERQQLKEENAQLGNFLNQVRF